MILAYAAAGKNIRNAVLMHKKEPEPKMRSGFFLEINL